MNALRLHLCAGTLCLALSGCGTIPTAVMAGLAAGAASATIAGEGSTAVHNILTLHKDVEEAKRAIPEIKKEVATEAAKVKAHIQAKRAHILTRIRRSEVGKFLYAMARPAPLPEPDARPHIDVPALPPATKDAIAVFWTRIVAAVFFVMGIVLLFVYWLRSKVP